MKTVYCFFNGEMQGMQGGYKFNLHKRGQEINVEKNRTLLHGV